MESIKINNDTSFKENIIVVRLVAWDLKGSFIHRESKRIHSSNVHAKEVEALRLAVIWAKKFFSHQCIFELDSKEFIRNLHDDLYLSDVAMKAIVSHIHSLNIGSCFSFRWIPQSANKATNLIVSKFEDHPCSAIWAYNPNATLCKILLDDLF